MDKRDSALHLRGFSFIELLVVLAIVGILSVVGVAYRMDRTGPAVKGAVNTLSACLAQARHMARASGKKVLLTPSGIGNMAELEYAVIIGVNNDGTDKKGIREAYRHGTEQRIAQYSSVSAAVPSSLLGDLPTRLVTSVNDQRVISDGAWTKNLFAPITATSPALSFDTNGVISEEACAVVVGTTSDGTPLANGPIGVVVVTAPGNIFRYYRSSPTSTWVRL